MTNGNPLGLLHGGACAFRLPADAGCAALARSLLGGVMTALGLGEETVESGVLAVSELSTNAYRHGTRPDRAEPFVLPELWVWARSEPVPQLVVSVFDTNRDAGPVPGAGALMDENGRGLEIVAAVSADWGAYLTRSRLAAVPVRGKAAWFTLLLPASWPADGQVISPGTAANRLLGELSRRGIDGTRAGDDTGISLIRIPQLRDLNVWVQHRAFAWQGSGPRSYVRHSLLDLQDAAEHLVHTMERADDDGRGLSRPPGSLALRSTGARSPRGLR